MADVKLRSLSNRKEIVKLLKEFSENEIEVEIYNTLEEMADENSRGRLGVIFKVSLREGTFSIRSLDEDFSLFEKRKNNYIKIDSKEVAFSCFAENFGEKFGSFNLPNEVLMEEKRKYPRKPLNGKTFMKVRANGIENNLRVLDISKGGACLYIQEELDVFLKNFRTFEILSVSGVDEFPMTFAKIVHSKLQPGASIANSLKIGVEFDELIEEKLIEDFC